MKLSHRTKLAVAVLAALVLPSVLAWGVRVVVRDGDDAAQPAAGRRTSGTASPSPSAGSPSAGTPSAQVEGPPASAQKAQRLPSSVPAEPPTAVRLPGGAVVGVVPARTRADRSLDVPDSLRRAGWWRGGARVGDLFGSMLVAAHVDALDRGLGPFAALLTVQRGDRIVITSDHLRQVFRVSARRVIPREKLAQARWVSSFAGPHRLTLVTCAPPYIRSKGGYQNLAIVVAKPVGPPQKK